MISECKNITWHQCIDKNCNMFLCSIHSEGDPDEELKRIHVAGKCPYKEKQK